MNNGNNGKPRQINRVATPIKVNTNQTQQGASNINGQQVAQPQKVNGKTNQMPPIPPKKVRPKKEVKPKKIDTHDPTNIVFATILLIIFAGLIAFLGLYIVPKYLSNRRGDKTYNDATTTKMTTLIKNDIAKYTLTNNKYLDTANTYTVGEVFNFSMVSNGTDFDIMVNNKKITNSDYVLPEVGVVDDILIFITQDKEIRTTKVYAVSKDTEVLLELYNLSEEEPGMVIMPDSNSVIYNSVSIVLRGTRINKESLILDNKFGATIGYNICNTEIMNEQKITDNSAVYGTYTFTYLGDHKFSVPEKINLTSLEEYKSVNKLCVKED